MIDAARLRHAPTSLVTSSRHVARYRTSRHADVARYRSRRALRHASVWISVCCWLPTLLPAARLGQTGAMRSAWVGLGVLTGLRSHGRHSCARSFVLVFTLALIGHSQIRPLLNAQSPTSSLTHPFTLLTTCFSITHPKGAHRGGGKWARAPPYEVKVRKIKYEIKNKNKGPLKNSGPNPMSF